MSIVRNRAVLASVGVATATVTTFAGLAPTVTVAGAQDGDEASNLVQADPVTDGTYESCSAYFGYGKNEDGAALELTTFPVTVEGGTPSGEAPTVENGEIDVVLVLTDTDGNELRCVPEEVTEAEWDETWGAVPFIAPAFPGAGHYVYPDVGSDEVDEGPVEIVVEPLEPLVNSPAAFGDLGPLESVGFEVVGVPDGYTLVDPVTTTALPQVFAELGFSDIEASLASVVALVAAVVGPEEAAAYQTAIESCIETDEPTNADDPDLLAAAQGLVDFLVPTRPPSPPRSAAATSARRSSSPSSTSPCRPPSTPRARSPSRCRSSRPRPTAPPPAAAAVVTPTFTG